jgi:L-ascorbate metabolism protein UlaG (beta-lactamase superfamily)
MLARASADRPDAMITPMLEGEAFLADVAAARGARGLHCWWLGQSGFLLQWQGNHLLCDPYLSDSLTRKYATTDKPHVRMTERVIAPERLDFIDVVTASHHHTDHLDPETLGPLCAANLRLAIVAPEASRHMAAGRAGVPAERIVGLDAGGSARLGAIVIHAVPAAHESVEHDAQGHCVFLGYVVQLGPWTVYHSGDTILYPGMVETLRQWRIDLALLPINGRGPERRVAGNLWGREAAHLAHEIGAGMAIPCHYEMFTFNTATPEEFVTAARGLRQPHRVLRAGERWSST